MTNAQLYLSMGVPSLLVLLSMLLNLKQTKDAESRLGARIDGVDARLGARIDGVDARLGARIDGIDARLGARIDGIDARLSRVERTLEVIEHDLRAFYRDLGKAEARLDALEH